MPKGALANVVTFRVSGEVENLNPYPYNQCVEYMVRQGAGSDAVDYAKRDIDSRVKDLQSRRQRVNHILAGTNEVILRCDWNAVDRMESDALSMSA